MIVKLILQLIVKVPISISLDIKNVIDSNLIKKVSKENKIKFLTAYDINLLNANGNYLTNIDDDIIVYIPLNDSYKENDRLY